MLACVCNLTAFLHVCWRRGLQSPEGLCVSSLLEVQNLLLLGRSPCSWTLCRSGPRGWALQTWFGKTNASSSHPYFIEERKLQTKLSSNKGAHLSLPLPAVEMWDHATAAVLTMVVMLVIIHEFFFQRVKVVYQIPLLELRKSKVRFSFFLLLLL